MWMSLEDTTDGQAFSQVDRVGPNSLSRTTASDLNQQVYPSSPSHKGKDKQTQDFQVPPTVLGTESDSCAKSGCECKSINPISPSCVQQMRRGRAPQLRAQRFQLYMRLRTSLVRSGHEQRVAAS
jgi:hypothetical protein